MPQVAAERPTCVTLEAFKAAAIAECLGIRHYADRRDKTLFTELIDLRLCQDFGHGHCDSGAKCISDMCQITSGGPNGVLTRSFYSRHWRIAGLAFARHWDRY